MVAAASVRPTQLRMNVGQISTTGQRPADGRFEGENRQPVESIFETVAAVFGPETQGHYRRK